MSRTTRPIVALACVLALGVAAWMLRREPASPATQSANAPPSEALVPSPEQRTPRPRAAEAATPDPAVAADATSAAATCHASVHVTLRGTDAPAVGAKVVVVDATDAKHEATTDAAGVARIPEALPADFVSYDVALAGYLPVSGSHRLEPDSPTDIDVSLERATVAVGTVLEADGRPLPGAHVTVYEPTGSCTGPTLVAEATTGSDGAFRLDPMPAERATSIGFAAPRHVAARVEWRPGGDAPIEVRLAPAAVISGVVCDPNGKPVEDADVAAHPTAVPDALAVDSPSFAARTDSKGRYSLDALPLGCSWAVMASMPAFTESAPSAEIALDASHLEATLDLVLRASTRIDLAVVDPNGDPVTHATVQWGDENRRQTVPLGDGGRASITVAKPGTCQLSIDATGYPVRELSVDVLAGESKSVVARLDAGVEVAGVVVDDTGVPVAGARIDVHDYSVPSFERWTRSAESGADGTFRVTGVPKGAWVFDVEAELHVRAEGATAVAPAHDVRVVLPRFGSVSLSPRLPAGAARPKTLSVGYLPCDDRGWEISAYSGDWQDDWGDGGIVASVPPGKWRVQIRAEGYAAVVPVFDVAAGASIRLGDVMLAPSLTLAGRAVDALGKGVVSTWISIDGDQGTTDADGRFVFRNLPAGPSQIEAGGEEWFVRKLTYTLAPNSPPLVITLLRGGLLRGLLRGAAGGETIDLVPEAADAVPDDETSARVSKFGGFATRLPAGPWNVLVKRGDATLATKRVEITEGGETPVEIVLPR